MEVQINIAEAWSQQTNIDELAERHGRVRVVWYDPSVRPEDKSQGSMTPPGAEEDL